jgi:hypothetical protein
LSCRALVATLAVCVSAALVACSSTAPEPPGELPPPPPQATTRQGAPPPAPTLASADAGSPPEPTCVTVAPNNRCGLEPQCGCGMNETCDITNVTTGATSCVTGGAATLGRPCAQTGDCVAGLTCLYGACRPYCATPRSKCGVSGTELCVEVLDDNDKPEPNHNVCTITCDPRAPQAVCGTNACLWFATYYAPAKVSDCNFQGTVDHLKACTSDYDCKAGMACIDHPSANIGKECEKWCRIGVAGDCPANFKCNDVFGANAPVINGVKEGICQDN